MKKILFLLSVVGLLNACATTSDNQTGNDSTATDSTIVTDSIPADTTVVVDTTVVEPSDSGAVPVEPAEL